MYVNIHWLFLGQFSLRWWTLPSHSLASARAVGSAGQCRFVGLRIPRMCVGIHRLFLCKFSLRWGSTAPFTGLRLRRGFAGQCRFVNHESRECAWAFTGSFSVSSPSAGGHRPIHWFLPCHICSLGGDCFFRPKAFVSATCSVFRRTEPAARADVVSWAHESRESTWTFTGSSSVSSPSAGGHYRPVQ